MFRKPFVDDDCNDSYRMDTGSVPVFRPTVEQFADFPQFIQRMENCGAHKVGILASVLGLVETSGALQLEDVLQHRVTTESLRIFNVNGTIRKAQKSFRKNLQ